MNSDNRVMMRAMTSSSSSCSRNNNGSNIFGKKAMIATMTTGKKVTDIPQIVNGQINTDHNNVF
eukprot:scaffold259574_cov22-Prasinocladus_malaysianus.AAC.1